MGYCYCGRKLPRDWGFCSKECGEQERRRVEDWFRRCFGKQKCG